MHTQGGGPPPRSSGMGLGLGIGLAAGVGGVLSLGVVALIGIAAWRGPTLGRANARNAAAPMVPAAPITPTVVAAGKAPSWPAAAPAQPAEKLPAPSAAVVNSPVANAAAEDASRLFERTAPAVVRIEVRDDKFRGVCTGTGFFVSADGLLVTNHHVIKDGAFATVDTADGTTLFVEGVAAVDAKQDLAVLKVKGSGLKCLSLGGDERPPIGTRVFAIGHPRGFKNPVLSGGLVSSIGEALGGDVPSIGTTTAVSHGSSGGPLVAPDGTVVGVIAAGREDAQNMNYAVPVALLNKLMKSVATGSAVKPLASAGGSALTREQAEVLRNAWAAIDRGQLRDAAQVLAEARAKMQGSNAYWVTAGALHMELKNYALATEAFENAVRLKGDAVESHAMLGTAYFLQQKYREAARSMENASRLAPRDPKYHAAAGRCYMELNMPDRAVGPYKKATTLAPGDAVYASRLGDAYFAMLQYADAMMAYQRALKLNAADDDAYVSLGQCFMNLRRNDEAEAPLRKALSLNPRSARAHLQLGVWQLEKNQPGSALASFQAAAKLDPGGKIGQAASRAAAAIQALMNQEQAARDRQQQQQQQQQEQGRQQPAQDQPQQVYRITPRAPKTPPRIGER